MRIALASLATLGLAQLLSCGGTDPMQCDNNNCTLPGRTTVKWIFDAYPALLFPDDSCGDMGAAMVHAVATNNADPTITATMDAQCANGQTIFLGLAPGTYTIALTPVDLNGAPLVTVAATNMVVSGQTGADTEITVNVPYTSWSGSYTGTFFFRLKWNGLSCEAANPAIATQLLKLTTHDGNVVTALSDSGHKLDGTDPEACRKLSEPTAQSVQGLPFGPATFVVVGKDATGTIQFTESIDTFVGAAKNNPEIDFNVVPDAGVDSGVVPDAVAADAAVD